MKIENHAVWIFAAALCGNACGGSAAANGPSEKPSESSSSPGAPGGATDTPPAASDSSMPATATATAPASTEFTLDDADWSKTWRQLSTPSISMNGALVAGAPRGWIAISTRDQDGTKNPPPPDSFAYFSKDGTHWQAIPTPGDYPLQGGSVAYGAGHYLLTGSRRGATVVLDSTQGETWHEQTLEDLSFGFYNGPATYAHDRFFYISNTFWGSVDGAGWSALPHDYPFALFDQIAYGNGVYLGVGTQTQLSTDGVEWHAVPIDCTLPNACSPLGDDTLDPNPVGGVFFAEGRFHIWQYTSGFQTPDGELTSPDGETWQYVPGPFPDAYVAGHFVQFRGMQPTVWLAGDSTPRPIDVTRRPSTPDGSTAQPSATAGTSDAITVDDPPPAEADFSWSDGLDCTNARCVLIHSQLYLVP